MKYQLPNVKSSVIRLSNHTGKSEYLRKVALLFLVTLSFAFNADSQNLEDPHSKLHVSPALSDKSSDISPEIKDLLHYYEKQIYFTKNDGQWPASVVFKADFPLGQAVATNRGMLVGTFDPEDISAQYNYGMQEEEARKNNIPFNEPKVKVKGHAWMMNFLNSSSLMTIESKTRHRDVFNYFNEAPSRNKTNVGNYQEVWYMNVYDKVDVRYYPSQEGTLEYDMVCKPGFNKKNIAIQMEGIANLYLKQNGSLVLETSIGEMTLPAPVAYQIINGKKILVDAHYAISGKNVVKFNLGNYDASQTLIIDPIALRWATLINSNSTGDNHGHCIWVDPTDGAIYVVARVVGSTNLITPGAFDESANGNLETIVGKYTEPNSVGGSGTRVWQTYIGGSGDDNPYAMEQGPDGNLYITGYTSSTNFPLLGGSAFGGSSIDDGAQQADNIFITKINKDGNSIKSAVVGGNGSEGSFDLRFSPDGGIVICGNTRSTNLNTLHPGIGASNTNYGIVDVIVFKINSDLSALSWMKNYGGSGGDQATIMLNNPVNGDIYIAGYTSSSSVFPIVNARQATKAGSVDGFVQKLKSNGTIVWSSYFNSAQTKSTNILCMEFNTLRSTLYFAGITGGLNATNVPVSGAFDNSYNGGSHDFFVASMDTNQVFNASTYIGGANDEVNMMGLNVDLNNDVYVFGYTNSTNFPVTSSALQAQLNNTTLNGANPPNDKAFLKLSSSLSNLLFSTYYGGASDDFDPVGERGIKFSNCRIYTIVTARSNDIPLTQGAITTSKLSSGSVYEPGLVVWANPPDLFNNTISGSQTVCPGGTPSDFTGSVPSYLLPNISRNGINSSYPATLPSATTYQWQRSNDSTNWINVLGGATQNLDHSLIGNIYQKTYFRRIIGGDACVIAGAANQFITVSILKVNGNVSNIACYGTTTGSITANNNGSSNCTYLWNTGATTKTISNLAAGTYTVTVTDPGGCSASKTYSITQPSEPLSIKTSSTPANCLMKDGTATVIAAGGTPSYTYVWSNGATSSTTDGLLAGVYSVTVTDYNGCSLNTIDTVQNITSLSASESHTNISCHGGISTVTISALAGVEPYTGTGTFTQTAGTATYIVTDANGCINIVLLTLSEPQTLSVSESHTAIVCHGGSSTVTISAAGGVTPYTGTGSFSQSAGTVTYTVTDANGCNKSVVVTISEPASISVSESHTDIACHGSSSTVTISASGGLSPYTGTGSFSQSAGTVTYTVTDANGCSNTADATVSEPESILVSESHTDITCNGGSSEVTISASGGASPYAGTGTFSQSAGTVTYTVTDANGCNSTVDATISAPVAVVVSESHTDITCHGGSSTVTISASSGAEPYTGTGTFPQNAGTVTYTVTDANGCSNSVDATISEPESIIVSESHTDISCHGGSSTVTISATGGTAPYTGTGTFSQNAGTVTYTVTDANGCNSTLDAVISEPESIVASEIHTDITCHGGSSTVTISASGGAEPYTGTGTFPQSAGSVTYTVTDANGCNNSVDAVVTEPETLSASESHTVILCHGDLSAVTISATGGTAPYTGTGSFSQHNGTVTYTVTDANGCQTTVDASVVQPASLSVSESHTDIMCPGSSSTVTITASGGTAPYIGTGTFSQSAGAVTYTVIDANGCSNTVDATISETEPILVSESHTDINCHGGLSTVTISASGGAEPYTGTGTFTQSAGTVTYTVTDANGCNNTVDAIVSEPASIAVSESHSDIICHGGSSTVTISASGGAEPYTGTGTFSQNAGTITYTISDANGCSSTIDAVISEPESLSALQTHTPITCHGGSSEVTINGSGGVAPYSGTGLFSQGAGNHLYTIVDDNGCSASIGVAVSQPNPIDLINAIVCLKPQCYGDATGSIDITPVGGTPSYTYLWNDGTTTEDRSGLYSGVYTVTATDANGCSATLAKQVASPPQLVITETHVNVSTNGGHNGSIDITVTGGSGKKTYLWNNGSRKEDRAGLYAGTYTVTVTDGHGCTASASIVITQPSNKEVLPEDYSVKLYPNPTSNEFVVELNLNSASDARYKIQLVSTIGQVVGVRNGNFVNGNLREIFNSNQQLPDGIYQVQIIWNDEMIVQPVAITN